MITCLIMAGGKGTRFWPVSTPAYPKQYTSLVSKDSLLKETLSRVSDVVPQKGRYIVTVESQKTLAAEQAEEFLPSNQVILEPEGRNTAPCIFYGILKLLADGFDKETVVAVLPSDHVIHNHQKFSETLESAAELASKNQKLVTIGINPTSAHTGYGYIEKGGSCEQGFYVSSFKEKPHKQLAEEYVASQNYFWNAGMFIAPINVLLKEIEVHAPEYYDKKDQLMDSLRNFSELKKVYQSLPKESIDYAVMEKSQNVLVIEASFDWNDLGSWDALEDVLPNTDGGVIAASKDTRSIESSGNIIFAPEFNVSLIGVNDLVVVANGDQLMIVPKSMAQRVKELSN